MLDKKMKHERQFGSHTGLVLFKVDLFLLISYLKCLSGMCINVWVSSILALALRIIPV